MSYISHTQTVRNYLKYIGYELEVDDKEYSPITQIEYRKKITKDEKDSSSRHYFLEKMKEISHEKDTDLHCFTSIAFEKLTNHKMSSNSMLIALAQYFEKNDAQPKHYHHCLEQYIKTYHKNIWKNEFFDYFKIENFDPTYLSCLGVANPTVCQQLKNKPLNQAQYIFLALNDVKYEMPHIKFDKTIEAFFLLSLETRTLDERYCRDCLEQFIHTTEQLNHCKQWVNSHTKENFIYSANPFAAFMNGVSLGSNKELMLTAIHRHELFLELNHKLEYKSSLKLKKI